jgi:hypothetical protein
MPADRLALVSLVQLRASYGYARFYFGNQILMLILVTDLTFFAEGMDLT